MTGKTITVLGMNITKDVMELYDENLEKHIIQQGDPELLRVKNLIQAPLLRGEHPTVTLSPEAPNHYQAYEKHSGGTVKLFRVAKAFLKSLFVAEPQPSRVPLVPEVTIMVTRPEPIGNSPFVDKSSPSAEQTAREALLANTQNTVYSPEDQKRVDAINEVMKNATPASSADFNDKNLDDDSGKQNNDDTMVAIVDGKTLIPDVHHLKNHMAHAVANKNDVGLQNFLKRVAAVNSKRGHSVEDLMKFMKRNDMPIAADGSLIAYKALRSKNDDFVDIHSGMVPQNVGTRVFMNESLVDPNRHNDCSNGLHIARRGYVGGFPGDGCFLVRINPEDVIAVPVYDSNKMRVSGYDIIHMLSYDAYSKLKSDRPFTDNSEDQKVLADVLAGRYPPLKRTVEIGGNRGTNLTITNLTDNGEPMGVPSDIPLNDSQLAQAIEEVGDGPSLNAPVLDPLAVANEVAEVKKQTNADKANELYEVFSETEDGSSEEKAAAQALYDFKRTAKKGWSALDISDAMAQTIERVLGK